MIPSSTVTQVKNLIIADDDWDDQVLLKEIISEHELAPFVTTVSDGAQLMKIIEGGLIPDLVLLDLNMPNKNGVECLYEIRTVLDLKQLPVVMLSTSKDRRDIENCFTNGAHLFFSKPYTYEALKSLVHGILDIDWNNFPGQLNKTDFVKIAAEGLHAQPES